MKNLVYIFLFSCLFSSCEEVIDVDVPTENPRLSIDALIKIDGQSEMTTARITAKLTNSFFDENTPAQLTRISIVNPDYVPQSALDQNELLFEEVASGVYEASKNTLFFTQGELRLLIEHDGQSYLALTQYVPAVPIDNIEQGDGSLFSENETEIIVTFTDNGDREDFYLFDFSFNEYLVTEDEFYQGQSFQFSFFYDEGMPTNEALSVSLMGVNEAFYNYMNQLIVQSGGDQGPFQTPAATVRGNIINVTDIDNIGSFDNVGKADNFALGFFAVVQEYKSSITIE